MSTEMEGMIEGFEKMGVKDGDVQPFRFFDLPYELRLKVYEILLVLPKTIDLDPLNHRTIPPRLRLFYTSHRMHEEASRVFYGYNTFRIFPVHGRFIYTKAPLLARLPPRYRAAIHRLELRLGPGWTKPPKYWVVDDRLGLNDAQEVRLLRVFLDFDPACHVVFEGFRVGQDFYTKFCLNLLQEILLQTTSIGEIEFDAWSCVPKSSPLLQALVNTAKANNKRIVWGPDRGWDKIVDIGLASVLDRLSLSSDRRK